MPMPEHIKEKIAKLKKGEKLETENRKAPAQAIGRLKKEVTKL